MRPLFDGVRIKMLAGYSALILVIAISFLFSPEPDSSDAYCGQYMHLSESAGFVFNCDAADYCMTAKFPSRLLQDSATRQSRPLYILTASVIGMPLQWIVDNSDLAVFKKFGDEAEMYVGYYAGYILINFISLLLCILLFRAIVFSIRPQPSLIYYAVLIALISNEITKTFFWTAHQQFFSLLTPLLSIWWALRIQNRQKTQAEIGRL